MTETARAQQYPSTPESREVARDAQRRRRSTPEGLEASRAAGRRYIVTPKGRKINRASGRRYRATSKGLAYRREYMARRCREDQTFRLLQVLRSRLHKALRGLLKAGSTMELVGCTVEQARAHIESTLREGWSWENYGMLWEVDHAKSCARFDLSDPMQQRECFHWTNLRAYPIFDNRSEGAR